MCDQANANYGKFVSDVIEAMVANNLVKPLKRIYIFIMPCW